MFDPSYNSVMQRMGFGDAPNCAKCGLAMTPENSKRRPELFLHDDCLPDELKEAYDSVEPAHERIVTEAESLMPLDLSSLSIPPVSVVPEPTAEHWETLREAMTSSGMYGFWLGVACSLSRRCRSLEAENKEHWPATGTPEQVASSHQKRDALYQLCKRIVGDKPNQWLSEAAIETIEKLEADVTRLRLVCEVGRIDPDRCTNRPGGEQCALRAGHAGHCKWLRGD